MKNYDDYKRKWYLQKKKQIGRNCKKCNKKIGFTAWFCKSCASKKRAKKYTMPKRNRKWFGNKRKYNACHMWLRNNYGSAIKCSECGATKNSQWANKSGKYKREISDWVQLCASCHFKFDNEKLCLKRELE